MTNEYGGGGLVRNGMDSNDPKAYFNKSTFEVDKNLEREHSNAQDSMQNMTPSDLVVNNENSFMLGSISPDKVFGTSQNKTESTRNANM